MQQARSFGTGASRQGGEKPRSRKAHVGWHQRADSARERRGGAGRVFGPGRGSLERAGAWRGRTRRIPGGGAGNPRRGTPAEVGVAQEGTSQRNRVSARRPMQVLPRWATTTARSLREPRPGQRTDAATRRGAGLRSGRSGGDAVDPEPGRRRHQGEDLEGPFGPPATVERTRPGREPRRPNSGEHWWRREARQRGNTRPSSRKPGRSGKPRAGPGASAPGTPPPTSVGGGPEIGRSSERPCGLNL